MKAGFACALLMIVPAAADAEILTTAFDDIPNIRFEYYDVEGTTPREIYNSMRARSPYSGDGVANTIWNIRTGWRQTRRGSTCVVADPMASLTIIVQLPRLASEAVTRQGLIFWQRVRGGLEEHEAGHARIAWEHRHDFLEAARDASCGSIKAVAAKTQARIEEIQEDYDRRTRHGLTQIPPPGSNE